MNTVLISFYSDIEDKTYYSDNASRLIHECEELGIPYDIREKKTLGSYQLNCLSKPQYILDTLNELDRPLIWMDIDSKLHKKIDIYDQFNEGTDVVVTTSNTKLSGIKASPLYFGNTTGARDFISSWIDTTKQIIENDAGVFDHEPLFNVVNEYVKKINVKFVGAEYCTWPGHTNENTYITMGLTDSECKKESLRKLGFSEEVIEWQSPGDIQ